MGDHTESNRSQHLTVEVRPRQTRVAYLIDPAVASLPLIDAIFSTSIEHWGGRLFPIIPVVNGDIAPEYWALLRKVDPDWIYSYCVLSQETVDRLISEINPVTMERHSDHLLSGEHQYFSPALRHRLVRVRHLLPYATEMSWSAKPLLITYKTKSGKLDSLIARNFGILRADVLSEPIPDDISQFSFDESETFASLTMKLAESRERVIHPHAASMSRAVVDSGKDTHETGYTVFVGNDAETWIAFWNHIFTLEPASRDSWNTFCIPKAALEDEPTTTALTKFFRRYAHGNGSHPPFVEWTSSELGLDELKSLTKTFTEKHLNLFFRYSQRNAWSFTELPTKKLYCFGFRGGGLGTPELFGATAHQIPAAGGLVSAPGLPFLTGPDEQWVQDVRIQYLSEHPYYANEDLQYQLPKRSGVASLFSGLPGRVDADGGLSFLTRRREDLYLRVPSDRVLLLTAIQCGRRSTFDDKLSRRELPPIYERQQASDKARYCQGVLDLFGGIFSASHTFDTRFWRKTFQYLVGTGGQSTNPESRVVYSNIAKFPQRWTIDDSIPQIQEYARIEREIIRLAQHVRVRLAEVTFEQLVKDLEAERTEFLEQFDEKSSIATSSETRTDTLQDDLRRSLQNFVEAKILRQGTNTRCRNCGFKNWQDLSSLQQEFKCAGCGASVHCAVEATWYYRLNTLLRGAIVEHGTIPVIAALAAARQKAKQSFIFSPGLAFFENYESKQPVAEVDTVCLVDGEVWIGEVKTDVSEFKPSEFKKLVREAKKMLADKAFVFASDGDQSWLQKRCAEANKSEDFPIIQLWPSTWGEMPSFHV